MTITITRADATRILGQIVQEYGEDYVYQSHGDGTGVPCRYIWNGEPDCIIGKLLARLGADEPFLDKCDTIGSIRELAEQGKVNVEDDVLLYALRALQSAQDNGEAWGIAYQRYLAELGATLV